MEPPSSPRSNALTCLICYERYTDETGARAPLVLPCGHTYCHECVVHFPHRTCPTCRKPIPSDTGDIPRNHALLDLLSSFPPPPPTGKEALKAEGDAHMRSHNYPAAVASYSAAIALDPQAASTALLYSNRSAAHALMSDWAAAAENAQSAIDRDAGFVKAYHRLAQARQQLGQLDEARAAVMDGLRRDPHNAHLAKIRDDIFDDCSVLGIDVSSTHCIVSRLSAAAAVAAASAAGGRGKSSFESVVSLTQAKLAEQNFSMFDEGLYRFIRSAAGEGVSGVVISYPPHLSSEEVQTIRHRASDAGLIVLRAVVNLSLLVLYLAAEVLPGLSNEVVAALSIDDGRCSLALAHLEADLIEMKRVATAPLAAALGQGRDYAAAVIRHGVTNALHSVPPSVGRFYLLGEAKTEHAVEAAILARNAHAYIGKCSEEHPSRGAALHAAQLSAFASARLRGLLLLDVTHRALSLQVLDETVVKMIRPGCGIPIRKTHAFALTALSPDYPGRGYLRIYEDSRHIATLCIDGLDPTVPQAEISAEIDANSIHHWHCSQVAWATGRAAECAVTAWPGMRDGRGPRSTFAELPLPPVPEPGAGAEARN